MARQCRHMRWIVLLIVTCWLLMTMISQKAFKDVMRRSSVALSNAILADFLPLDERLEDQAKNGNDPTKNVFHDIEATARPEYDKASLQGNALHMDSKMMQIANKEPVSLHVENADQKEGALAGNNGDEERTRLLNDDQMIAIEKRFQARRDHVREVCKKMPPREVTECQANVVKNSLKNADGSDIMYCAIYKTGSTFWRRVIYMAGGWAENNDPYSQTLGKVYEHTADGFSDFENITFEELTDVFGYFKSMMFVRDPFSRLLSGFLDRFYSPNIKYWGIMGRPVIKHIREGGTNRSLTCGHDVTFTEFIIYILGKIGDDCFDRHFKPLFKYCEPCKLAFEYIGKYETLEEDTYFLLEKFNISKAVQFADFDESAKLEMIRFDAERVFRTKNELTQCIPFRCALFRQWKRLQSRGVISKHLDLPYKTNQEADDITMEEFVKALKDAHAKSDPIETAQNREEAMAEAFGSLPEAVRYRLLDALGPDFDLFDYERNPGFLQGYSPLTRELEYIPECPFTFEDT